MEYARAAYMRALQSSDHDLSDLAHLASILNAQVGRKKETALAWCWHLLTYHIHTQGYLTCARELYETILSRSSMEAEGMSDEHCDDDDNGNRLLAAALSFRATSMVPPILKKKVSKWTGMQKMR